MRPTKSFFILYPYSITENAEAAKAMSDDALQGGRKKPPGTLRIRCQSYLSPAKVRVRPRRPPGTAF